MSLLDDEIDLMKDTNALKTLIESRDGDRIIDFDRGDRNRFNVGDIVYMINGVDNEKCKIIPQMVFGVMIQVDERRNHLISYKLRNDIQHSLYGDKDRWVSEIKLFRSKEEAIKFMLSGADYDVFSDMMTRAEEKERKREERKKNSIFNKIKRRWQK